MLTRVVVTGLGVVSSIGIGKKIFFENLLAGRSGISEITGFDTSKFKRHYGGEIKNFDPAPYLPREICQFFGRASQFAITATKLALQDSNTNLDDLSDKKLAIIIGTTMTEALAIDTTGRLFVDDRWDEITKHLLLSTFSPSIARNVGFFLKLTGINALIPNACAAGNYSIGYGYDLIQKGEIEFAIVGGSEAFSQTAFQGFQRLYAMAQQTCSPFDKNRQGMLLGEGAGILILESLDNAKKRNTPIYAEVLGYGLSCDAFNMTIPNRIGIKKAMSKAIKNSGLQPADIDYISAHGTGTIQNDKEESGAINELFENRKVPVSSIKSMLGHCMGAASAIEALTCCYAIKEGVIPPTINFNTADPDCNIDCVPNNSRKINLKNILNNGFAFGGNNCCLVLKKT